MHARKKAVMDSKHHERLKSNWGGKCHTVQTRSRYHAATTIKFENKFPDSLQGHSGDWGAHAHECYSTKKLTWTRTPPLSLPLRDKRMKEGRGYKLEWERNLCPLKIMNFVKFPWANRLTRIWWLQQWHTHTMWTRIFLGPPVNIFPHCNDNVVLLVLLFWRDITWTNGRSRCSDLVCKPVVETYGTTLVSAVRVYSFQYLQKKQLSHRTCTFSRTVPELQATRIQVSSSDNLAQIMSWSQSVFGKSSNCPRK